MAQPEPAILGRVLGGLLGRVGDGVVYGRVPSQAFQSMPVGNSSGATFGGGRLCEVHRIGRCFSVLLSLLLVLGFLLVAFPKAASPSTARALAVLLVLLAGLVGALLPWWLRSTTDHHIWMARGNSLSAGVMFAAGIIHLLGDAVERLMPPAHCSPGLHGCNEQLLHPLSCPAKKDGQSRPQDYPQAMLLCTAGFMLTFVIEEIGYWLNMRIRTTDTTSEVPEDDLDFGDTATFVSTSETNIQPLQQATAHDTQRGQQPPPIAAKLMLAAALSFHSIMEGMALGAVPSDDVLEILLTILTHKSLAAFALGSTLLAGDEDPSGSRFFAVSFLFAIASPAGSVVAIWADTAEPTFAPVVLSLSSGTFICAFLQRPLCVVASYNLYH